MEIGTYTENYNLLKPDEEDFYDVGDFNKNAEIIDSALKALSDKGISLEELLNSLADVAKSGSYNDLTNKPEALKNPYALTVQFNGTTQKSYNGSSAQTVNITPDGIGASASNHTHKNLFFSNESNLTVPFMQSSVYSNLSDIENNCALYVFNGTSSFSDAPSGNSGICFTHTGNGNRHQIYYSIFNSNDIYVRRKQSSSNYTAWVKINDGGNADTVDGKHASDLQNYNNLTNKAVMNSYTQFSEYSGTSPIVVYSNDTTWRTTLQNIFNMMGYLNAGLIYIPQDSEVFELYDNKVYPPNAANLGSTITNTKGYPVYIFTKSRVGLYVECNVTLANGTVESWECSWSGMNKAVTEWKKKSDGGNADTLQGYRYTQLMNEVNKYRTEIVIRADNTPNTVKGYYYADYVCSDTNARSVIQSAIDNAPKGSIIRLLPGNYNINCYENGNASPIIINKGLTIAGSTGTYISQIGDTGMGEAGSVFKKNTTSDGNIVVFKDFTIYSVGSNISSAEPLFQGTASGASGTLKDVIWDNIFFLVSHVNDYAVVCNKIQYCRMNNCRIYKANLNYSDSGDIYFCSGSTYSIISDMMNTGSGYFKIQCADSTVSNSCKFNGNHRTQLRIGANAYTNI